MIHAIYAERAASWVGADAFDRLDDVLAGVTVAEVDGDVFTPQQEAEQNAMLALAGVGPEERD